MQWNCQTQCVGTARLRAAIPMCKPTGPKTPAGPQPLGRDTTHRPDPRKTWGPLSAFHLQLPAASVCVCNWKLSSCSGLYKMKRRWRHRTETLTIIYRSTTQIMSEKPSFFISGSSSPIHVKVLTSLPLWPQHRAQRPQDCLVVPSLARG